MGVLQRIKGKHMAPIRHSIPAKFREYLPNDFLNSAVVDSYDSEDLLRPFFPSTIVHPGLGRNIPIDYTTSSAIVKDLKAAVTPALFDIMLSFNHIYNIECGVTDSWSTAYIYIILLYTVSQKKTKLFLL